MKRIFMAAIALAFSTGIAFAADPMAAYYGNTLKVTGPDGTTKIWYKADKTYTGVDAKGVKIGGTWEVTGDQVCATQKDPAPPAGQEKHCGKAEARKVGDSWESTGSDGKKVTLTLVTGS